MNRILIILTIFSLSVAGTTYLAFDTEDSEVMSFGYNHNIKSFKRFDLAVGGNYSSKLKGESYFNEYNDLALASIYLLPSFSINVEQLEIAGVSLTKRISFWTSLGYSLVINDSGIEDDCSNNFPNSENGWEGTTEDCELNSGFTYGLGIHFMLNKKMGMGVGMLNQPLELTSVEGQYTYEDMERINVYFSYQF